MGDLKDGHDGVYGANGSTRGPGTHKKTATQNRHRNFVKSAGRPTMRRSGRRSGSTTGVFCSPQRGHTVYADDEGMSSPPLPTAHLPPPTPGLPAIIRVYQSGVREEKGSKEDRWGHAKLLGGTDKKTVSPSRFWVGKCHRSPAAPIASGFTSCTHMWQAYQRIPPWHSRMNLDGGWIGATGHSPASSRFCGCSTFAAKSLSYRPGMGS
jgi:hypothetical protein